MRHRIPDPLHHLPAGTWAAGAAGAIVVLLLAGLPMFGPVAGARAPLSVAATGTCSGATEPAAANGTLVLVGNSTPLPSVSGVPVHVHYYYTEIEKVGGATTETCVAASAAGPTGSGGSFSIPLPLPANHCLPSSCFIYEGPYAPLTISTAGAPSGYFEKDPSGGTRAAPIFWEADLYAVALNVTGSEVVSTDAPVRLSAVGHDALGGPAVGSVAYHWHSAGLGWSNSSATGPNTTVQGIDSGWPGSVSVTAQATYASTTETVQSGILTLLPIATRVLSGTVSPDPVDPGVPITFVVRGTGAPGYSYSATVDPGLGAGTVAGGCANGPGANGTTNLTCQVRAAYPTAGTAYPTASLSNGYSSAQLTMTPVSVHPVEQVSLTLPRFVTYPNLPLALRVNVTNGTGSAPYGPACLSLGDGSAVTCLPGGGTNWTFNVSFRTPGSYELRASVSDRFGENVSSSTAVLVVPLLTARANGSSTLTLVADQPAPLSVVVAGGALPISSWWNLSGAQAFFCAGNLDFDGTITCPFVPSSPGSTNVTVTLRDALGSVTTVLFRLTVTPASGHSGSTGPLSLLSGSGGILLLGLAGGLAVGALFAGRLLLRRRRPGATGADGGVEENELERMARGREHLLSRADPSTPRRPDELVAGWSGPPVAPEEWAEWVAGLVADGSLLPSRGPDRRLVYRRATPRPSMPVIRFDPTAVPYGLGPTDDTREEAPDPGDDQDGG